MIEVRYHQLEAIEVYNDLSVEVVGALLKSWLIFTVCHPNAGLMKSGLPDCHAHLPLGFFIQVCYCSFFLYIVIAPLFSCQLAAGWKLVKSVNALLLKWLLEVIPDGLYMHSLANVPRFLQGTVLLFLKLQS